MTDIPLLAMLLGTIYYMLLADKTRQFRYYVTAVLLLTTGLFIKYTLLPVFAAIALVFILRKQYRNLLLLLIPVVLLILWSAWNYWEYGGIHILERSTKPRFNRWDMLWSYFSCLGAIATFSLFLINYFLKGRLNMMVVYGITLLFLVISYSDYLSPGLVSKTLNVALEIVFFINGLIIVAIVLKIAYTRFSKSRFDTFIQSETGLMLILFAALSVFLILLAPFIATRHLLLVLPFLLWLSAPAFETYKKSLASFSVAVAFIFTLVLSISDWQFAEFYRKVAKSIKNNAPPNSTIWASGAGGWQWYAKENGMHEYVAGTSKVQPGDYLVIPKGLSHYRVEPDINYVLITKTWGDDATFLSYFSAKDFSMYHTAFGLPAWILSKKPIDTIYILQCLIPQEQAIAE